MAKLNIRNRNKDKLGKDGKPKQANWEYRFEAAKVDGKRKHISKAGFRTKKEAEIAGAKAMAEYENTGKRFEPTEISVADYLDFWFDNYCKMELKYNSQLGYLNIIENHLKPTFGHYRLRSLEPSVLVQYANQLKLNGYSKAHLNGILSMFSVALDYAVEPMKYIKENPLKYVKHPKVERKPKERIILTNEEFNEIISRFPAGNRYHIPLLIGWHCGLRISETFGLTWDDIDFDKKTLTVNRQVIKRNHGEDVRSVLKKKGKKEERSAWYFTGAKYSSERTIKIGDTLLKALKEEKVRQMKNELEYGGYYTIHVTKEEKDEKGNDITRIIPVQKILDSQLSRIKLICVDENGEYTSTDSFKYCSRVIHSQLQLAFDYHSLRHTHATILIENGVSPKAVQARLGHKDIKTTLQTYVHNTDSMESAAVDVFEKVVNGNLSTK